MKEIKEYCDCCREEIDFKKDGVIGYRKRVQRWYKPYFPQFSKVDKGWELICNACWETIGITVAEARKRHE